MIVLLSSVPVALVVPRDDCVVGGGGLVVDGHVVTVTAPTNAPGTSPTSAPGMTRTRRYVAVLSGGQQSGRRPRQDGVAQATIARYGAVRDFPNQVGGAPMCVVGELARHRPAERSTV